MGCSKPMDTCKHITSPITTRMGEENPQISPLNGTNFPTWKIQCRMTLIKQGSWQIVSGEEVASDHSSSEEGIRTFKDRRDHALATIVLSIHPSLLHLLGEPEDPQVVWNILCEQFDQKCWGQRVEVRRKLYGVKWSGEGVQEHIHMLQQMFQQLHVVGDGMDEEQKVIHILSTLPNKYDNFLSRLLQKPQIPRLNELVDGLMKEERGMMFVKLDESVGEWDSFAERDQYNNNNTSDHTIMFSTSTPQHKHANLSTPHHNTTSETDNLGENVVVLQKGLCEASCAGDMDRWVVDSHATSHLCNNIKKFAHIIQFSTPTVHKIKLSHGFVLEAKGRGTVRIHVKTPAKVQRCKLQNVLFVPDLPVNVVSVSQVEGAGKRVVFQRYGCHFVDIATDETVASCEKIGNLYYVNCTEKERRTSCHKLLKGETNKMVQKDDSSSYNVTSTIPTKPKKISERVDFGGKKVTSVYTCQMSPTRTPIANQMSRNSQVSGGAQSVEMKADAIEKEEVELKGKSDHICREPFELVQQEVGTELMLWPEISPSTSDNSLPRVVVHRNHVNKQPNDNITMKETPKDKSKVKIRRRRFSKLRKMLRQDF